MGLAVTSVLSSGILKNIKNNLEHASPFMKLFWEEQKKYLTINPTAKNYNSMIIRFCFLLATTSPSA